MSQKSKGQSFCSGWVKKPETFNKTLVFVLAFKKMKAKEMK